MAGDWLATTLGDVIELKRGYDLPSAKRRAGSFPIISSGGVSGTHSEAMVSGPGVATGRYGTIGQVHYIDEDFWPLNTSLYVRDFKGSNPRFVAYFLKTVDFWAYSDKAAVPGINRNHLHEAQVVWPPHREQVAISNLLGLLDDKIEANRRMNKTVDDIAGALFKSWFVDLDPVRAKADDRPTGMSGEIEGLFPARMEDGNGVDVPEGWRVGLLSEVLDLSRLTVNPKSLEDASVAHFSIPAFDQDRLAKMEPASGIASNKARVPLNSVLFSKLNPETPRVWPILMDEGLPMIASTEFLPLQPKGYFGLAYAWRLLASEPFRDRAAACVTGTSKSHQRVQPASLMAQSALIPPEAVVRAFEEIVGPMLSRIEVGKRQSRTLAALRDLLLPKLMSGAIRVKDAEAMLEQVA